MYAFFCDSGKEGAITEQTTANETSKEAAGGKSSLSFTCLNHLNLIDCH